MKKKGNIEKVNDIMKKDYPFVGSISTYLNVDLEEKSNVELEIEAMKKVSKLKIKDKLKL